MPGVGMGEQIGDVGGAGSSGSGSSAYSAGAVLASKEYAPSTITTLTPSATAFTALDTVNLTVGPVTVPPSGIVVLTALIPYSTGGAGGPTVLGWVNHGGSTPQGNGQLLVPAANTDPTIYIETPVSGLTPGASLSFDLAARTASAGPTFVCQANAGVTGNFGPAELFAKAGGSVSGTAALTDSGWITPTLVNSWTAGEPVAYRKIGSVVYLRGSLTGGTNSSTAFTLPAGYVPANNFLQQVQGGGSTSFMQISSSGAVTPNFSTAGAQYLDGLNFPIN